ncbi:repulsive guidance molecule A-like [Clytia hemisphaerica]|uniref:Repulsive guidance molecule C-terminal domain-containing protein n=1 Tax=Clytia hemisphaerica TaxID=252671 RepID=A0A7M5V536_9CNID
MKFYAIFVCCMVTIINLELCYAQKEPPADSQRRPRPPLIEKPNLVEEKETTSNANEKSTELEKSVKKTSRRDYNKLCNICRQMYIMSDKEFEEKKDVDKFCVRVKQVMECMAYLKKERIQCGMFFNLVFRTGVFIQNRKHKCDERNITVGDLDSIFNKRETESTERVNVGQNCRYRKRNTTQSKLKYCGMFGDPHLKTFLGVRQTCIVEGTWTLLDNEYMKVEVTNRMVQNVDVSRAATATEKIAIQFKERDLVCSQEKNYVATSQYLPEAFSDGSRTNGPPGCLTTISKYDQDSVKLKACRSNTTILIRRVGRYLTFNILSPFEIVNKSSGLCHGGCPTSELFDYLSFFANLINQNDVTNDIRTAPRSNDVSVTSQLSYHEAMHLCSVRNVTDFYYDSCVFDLLMTGERQFSLAAKLAMLDAQSMDPKLRLRRSNSVVLQVASQQQQRVQHYSSSRTLTHSSVLVVLLTLWCVLALR